ncbi:MAG TPA: hypothetical protein VNA17_10610 [Pyrinomonadaceae bacterium]|nr:hypothetical protein [Pyrinomonadaceae bacterium]
MYCSGCGTELESGLNYCKRCGSRIAGAETSGVAQNLSNGVAAIGVFGVIGFVGSLYLMLQSPTIAPGTIMLVSFLYLATLFGLCLLVLRHIALFAKTPSGPPSDGNTGAPAYLSPASTAQLTESKEPPIGVTEHTTKNLDEIPRARK